MKEFIEIIREDPKAFIIDSIGFLLFFAGWIASYIILSCFIP